MAVKNHRPAFEQRISQQLQGLSDIAETLTLRVLQLEEKLESLEAGIISIEPVDYEPTNSLLTDSHDRLQQLQDLLDSPRNEAPTLRVVEEAPALVESEAHEQETELNEETIEAEADIDVAETEYVDDPQMDLLSA